MGRSVWIQVCDEEEACVAATVCVIVFACEAEDGSGVEIVRGQRSLVILCAGDEKSPVLCVSCVSAAQECRREKDTESALQVYPSAAVEHTLNRRGCCEKCE